MITFNTVRPLIVAVCIAMLSACGGSAGVNLTPDAPENEGNPPAPDNDDGIGVVGDISDDSQCDVATQNAWAYASMLDFYLFYEQVPIIDPRDFSSADALVRAVRFQERDDFSRVDDAQQSALAFDDGREFGLGFRTLFDNDGNPRISLVVAESPFGLAGVERGDIIVSVDGLDWSDEALSTGFSDRVLGTPDNPSTATWSFLKRDTGEALTVDITATEYSINTVVKAETYPTSSGGTVGYLAFSRFLNTSADELITAFDDFRDQNISELVLDLRYNGGGRVSVARLLASLIAGDSNAGKTIYDYQFNNKYTERDFTLELLGDVGDLNLSRLIVLTTDRSASASELVIAGLQPHLDVVTIGSATTGKPYVQYAYDRCDERLAVIEAEGFNANGVSVFGGIPATCFAEDDPTREFGRSDDGEFEGFLQAGLDFIETGACANAPPVSARSSLNTTVTDLNGEARQGMSMDGGTLAN